MSSFVTQVPPASGSEALAYFADRFRFETDCADVHGAMAAAQAAKRDADFVILDARTHALFDAGHVPGAISMPHGKIIASKLAAWADDTVFVVYCAGPHCNGAHHAAMRLARLGRPVKLMIGGITGWLDEGYALDRTPVSGATAGARAAPGDGRGSPAP